MSHGETETTISAMTIIDCRDTVHTMKEITTQTDCYLANLSSKTYVFEDKLAKY